MVGYTMIQTYLESSHATRHAKGPHYFQPLLVDEHYPPGLDALLRSARYYEPLIRAKAALQACESGEDLQARMCDPQYSKSEVDTFALC